ncbi:uncharacterized protein LOC108631654 [Ceratina calcarata]|uniref:Uncharacterized protein LOC108631654 n=1 Tax=Ceratina calcarata TaxID=156304 RepID=A0AAJ7NEG8_9HYME|nr:uncharacterized protein LOC108631654 [Ceratina calcarata]
MNPNDIIEEDEDVIIKGSSLYEHLHKLGYTDFESLTIEKLSSTNEEKKYRIFDFIHNVKQVLKKLYAIYLKIIQDDSVSKKQVEAILNSKTLLNDHSSAIYNFLDKYDCRPRRIMVSKFVVLGTILSPSLYISHNTHFRSTTNLFTLAILCCAIYMEHMRLNDHANLRSVVSLQNDLFDLCKKGMKILKYGYKIKLSKGKDSQQFFDLTAGRLKYLQPLMENLMKYLERVSHIYYHVSLILLKLLPENSYKEQVLTNFEDSSFHIRGEINYQKLKSLYYTYILTQSEMLHLLAVAYDNHSWSQSYKKVPEFKLARIVRSLIVILRIYKEKLSECINAYYNFKFEPMSYKYIGPDSSQWQDLYMHLYLASNKLETAYSDVSSILRDIDNDALDSKTNEDPLENTLQRLSTAQKNVETVKGFLEYSSLFLLRTRVNDSVGDRLEAVVPQSVTTPNNVRIITDSEPEIMDEVFEEYIREEYLKPLSEEADGISLYNYKRDKILFKNFMTELKDALIDKKKCMSERESRALQRMCKAVTKEPDPQRVPTPPPMPTFNYFLIESDDKISNTIEPRRCRLPQEISVGKSTKSEGNLVLNDMEPSPIAATPRNMEFSFLPPPFLKAEEETFIGSGENSEDDEVIEEQTE